MVCKVTHAGRGVKLLNLFPMVAEETLARISDAAQAHEKAPGKPFSTCGGFTTFTPIPFSRYSNSWLHTEAYFNEPNSCWAKR